MKSELGRGLSIERATQLARLARATLLISALADFESQDVWGTRLGLSEDGSVVVGACGWLVGIKRSLGALLLTASPLRDSKRRTLHAGPRASTLLSETGCCTPLCLPACSMRPTLPTISAAYPARRLGAHFRPLRSTWSRSSN